MRASLGLLVVLLLNAAPVLAQTPAAPPTPATDRDVEEARQYLRQANRLYGEGKYKEALPLYERVYRLYPTPNTMFNLAQTHRQLKNYEQAITTYETYLTMAPRAINRREVEQFIAELRKVVAEQRRAGELPPKGPAADLEGKGKVNVLPVPPTTDPAMTPPPATDGNGERPRWYRRWYVWAGVGLLVAGAAVGGGIAASRGGSVSIPMTTNGHMNLFRMAP